MSLNVPAETEFRWSGKKEKAAALVAADELPDDVIASTVGVNRRQITRWRQHPVFASRVQGLIEKVRDAVERRGISDLQNRVAAANDRWKLMQDVIAARAEEGKSHIDVPGAETGLLVAKPRLVKVYQNWDPDVKEASASEPDEDDDVLYSAKRYVTLYEWAVDTGLLHELREIEKQSAQMLGEWSEKRELTGPGGAEVVVHYVNDWRDPSKET